MKKWGSIMQVSFTYIGTVVGAGFATGQEILQFFSRYGWMATMTIGVATFMFIWLGSKMMMLASDLNAKSYEDLNRLLFGERIGNGVSLLTLISLIGTGTVMLAGAGSIFSEQLHLSYQFGLLFTLLLTYVLLLKGIEALMVVNTIVVPLMALFSALMVWNAWDAPGNMNWLKLGSDQPYLRIWVAPLLYAAFNLSMAQAVLVPLGSKIKDKQVLLWGGVCGGAAIGVMLLAGHFALSSQLPAILKFDIPTGQLVHKAGMLVQWLFLFVIYGEIFTTLLSDVYGLCVQLEQRTCISYHLLLPIVLVICFAGSQIGFKTLISFLYPLFGMLSMAWLLLIIFRKLPVSPG